MTTAPRSTPPSHNQTRTARSPPPYKTSTPCHHQLHQLIKWPSVVYLLHHLVSCHCLPPPPLTSTATWGVQKGLAPRFSPTSSTAIACTQNVTKSFMLNKFPTLLTTHYPKMASTFVVPLPSQILSGGKQTSPTHLPLVQDCTILVKGPATCPWLLALQLKALPPKTWL